MVELQPAKRTPPRRRMRFWPRTWRGWLATLAVVVVALLATGWILARMTPSWYAQALLDPNDIDVMDNAERAQKLLYFELHNAIERVPVSEQTWTITQDEINSFLAVQFAQLQPARPSREISTQSSATRQALVSDPLVVFTPGKVTISARSPRLPGSDSRGGVGSVVFSVGIVNAPDGQPMGIVKLTSVWIGNLPVPRSLVEGRIKTVAPSIVAAVEEAVRLRMNTSDASKMVPYVDEIVSDVTQARPFPLKQAMGSKRFVIKDLRVDQGQLTVVLAPLTPAAVSPRPQTAPSP
jgi:hypothetical protein